MENFEDKLKVIPTITRKNRLTKKIFAINIMYILSDLLSLLLSYVLSYEILSIKYTSISFHIYEIWMLRYVVIFSLIIYVVYSFLGMYEEFQRISKPPLLWNSIVVNFILICLTGTFLFYTKKNWHFRSFFVLMFCLNILMNVFTRTLCNKILNTIRLKFNMLRNPYIMIGTGEIAQKLKSHLLKYNEKQWYYMVDNVPMPEVQNDFDELFKKLDSGKYTLAIIIDDSHDFDKTEKICKKCIDCNISFKLLKPSFLKVKTPFSLGSTVCGYPLLHHTSYTFSNRFNTIGGFVARVLAVIGLIVLSPLFLIVSLAIKMSSKGPVFYIQERCGINGKTFRMYKFRTMCEDADKQIDKLRHLNETDGALFKIKHDPRLTKIGVFLRKTSIDELPQLINILKGEMRFIGPRPLPITDLKYFERDIQFYRHMSYPGLTCMWQICGRSNIGFEEMCSLDVWYLLNRSWVLDVKILMYTVWSVLFGGGAC